MGPGNIYLIFNILSVVYLIMQFGDISHNSIQTGSCMLALMSWATHTGSETQKTAEVLGARTSSSASPCHSLVSFGQLYVSIYFYE